MKSYLQRLGSSLMLPVAILPVAAILMGIGYLIDPAGMSGESTNLITVFLIQAGLAVIGKLPILFAVGVAIGMSKDKSGAAGLSGLVAFIILTEMLSSNVVALLTGSEAEMAFGATSNVFIAMIGGIIAAEMYNRFSETQLPMALAFFSGKRLVPILTAAVSLVVAIAFYWIWPIAYDALVTFGRSIVDLGALGAGLYGFFNRLLIPTGLHHALNNVFWFDLAGINDIGNFWANVGEKGVTGMYQAGFFPVMMFGLPAAALAMFKNAKPERRTATASLMLAAAFAAFFTGITEPLEFAFIFAAPGLYFAHAVLTGVSMFIAASFQWTAGFSFSAGLIDFMLSLSIPIANNPLMLMVLGLVMGVLYFFIFDFLIKKLDLKTPGREEDDVLEAQSAMESSMSKYGPSASSAGSSKYETMARTIYDGLGGSDNIVRVDNCTTRLRLTLNDTEAVNEAKVKSAGIPGVQKIDKTNYQVIVGTDVQFVADELIKLNDK